MDTICIICTSLHNLDNPIPLVYSEICNECFNEYHVCRQCTMTFVKPNIKDFYIHKEFICFASRSQKWKKIGNVRSTNIVNRAPRNNWQQPPKLKPKPKRKRKSLLRHNSKV